MKKALIHYFSATGNTYHMVKIIGDRISKQGYEVVYNNIECGNKPQVNDFTLHIFSYPVYGFGTPSIIIRYLKALQPVKGCKAAILCSCVDYEGQSLVHVTSILKKKGYAVFLTDLGLYPANWTQIINPINEEDQRKIFESSDARMIELADNLANYKSSIKSCSIFNLAWSWVVFILFSILGRRVLGKTFIADSSCTSCKKCVKNCPVNAIKLINGRPQWNWSCENCQRCINICPTRSIQTSLVRLVAFALSQIAMIFVVITLNKYYQLSFIINIVLYVALFLIVTFLIDLIMTLLEKIPVLRHLFQYSYTKKYRRYFIRD